MHATPPITPEQMRALAQADERERDFAGARKLALFNGAGFALCALALALGVWADPWLLLSAIVFAAFAAVELRGRRGLVAFDPRAATLLCANQCVFCVVVCAYAALQVYAGLRMENPVDTMFREHPQLSALAAAGLDPGALSEQIGPLYRMVVVGFYGVVALATLLFQGGSALYYARCKARLEAFVAETPAWVLEYKRLSPR
jgi:hypothetical protein